MIRHLDVMSRRRIRQALVAWHTRAVRCAMQFTRLACALPSSRQTQDRAMYVVCGLCCAVVLHVSAYRG